MRADKLTVEHLFEKTHRLEAPLFQRPYVWTEDRNWMPLWNALVTIADASLGQRATRPHFLGTIVLDQLPTPTKNLTLRQIIDGQQRLTTLQLALAAIRDVCSAEGADRYAAAFRGLTDNHVPLSDDNDDVFKVWPTNADRDEFRAAMHAGTVDVARDLARDDHLLAAAYVFFYETAARLARPHECSGVHRSS